MAKAKNKLNDLEAALIRFIGTFELVFDEDWEFSKYILEEPKHFIDDKSGTFINPNVEDESNNWWNRGSLLDAYRKLRQELDDAGYEVNLWE